MKNTVSVYTEIKHPSLIRYRGCEDIGGGFAMIFDWAEGECMGRMYEESHKRIMSLPIADKLNIFTATADFMKSVARQGWVATISTMAA